MHLEDDAASRFVSEAAQAADLTGASIVVRTLRGPARFNAMLEPDRPLTPASMIKVPIAAALVTAWSRGRLAPASPIAIRASDMTANDALSPLQPGARAGSEELARLMLTRSDNVATNALIEALGRDFIAAALAELGLIQTAVRRKLSGSLPLIDDPGATGRNAHPAREAADLFAAIAMRALPYAAWLHAVLAAQAWNDKLSRGLRPADRFAHKTGETSEADHDGGILDVPGGGRFVVVVYTGLAASPEADARLAEFMRRLRPALDP